MMRSLYSGISGLTNHQTRMDVIANNISNVNTIGYKRSRTVFQDIYSQTARQGSSGTATLGGTNTAQIGLGIKLSSIDVIHTSSAIQRTDYALDLMIEGDGFFVLNTLINADDKTGEGFEYYTRAGDFDLDNNNMLVSSHGYFVMGYGVEAITDADGNVTGYEVLNGDDDSLTAIDTTGYEQVKIDDKGNVWGYDENKNWVTFAVIPIATFPNIGGVERAGSSLFKESGPSGPVSYHLVGEPAVGVIIPGGYEMSNVDLATEFTDMIVTQRGFQANSRIITVSDTMLEELVNLKR